MYFYNIKLLDLKKKDKKESIKFVKKKCTTPGIKPGTFALEVMHQRRILREQLLFSGKMLIIYQFISLSVPCFFSISLFSITYIYIFLKNSISIIKKRLRINLRIPRPVSVCRWSNFAVRGVLHDVLLLTYLLT